MSAKIAAPNYTQVPNVVLDYMWRLSDAELRVLLCICRQTFGYHREQHKVSIKFIAKATGMSEQGVVNGTKRLLDNGVLERKQEGDGYVYSVVASECHPLNGVGTPLNGVEDNPLNGVGTPLLNGVEDHINKGTKESIGAPNGVEKPKPARKARVFTKPTLEEVQAHGAQMNPPLPTNECIKFFHHHESKGWVVGRAPMKCWKSAMVTWRANWQEWSAGRNGLGGHASTLLPTQRRTGNL